jgi:lipopolysaccharide transport system permease protein
MAGPIDGFCSVFLWDPFDIIALALALGMPLLIFIVGVAYFEKAERRFANIM